MIYYEFSDKLSQFKECAMIANAQKDEDGQ
jgi:hypothetical protein